MPKKPQKPAAKSKPEKLKKPAPKAPALAKGVKAAKGAAPAAKKPVKGAKPVVLAKKPAPKVAAKPAAPAKKAAPLPAVKGKKVAAPVPAPVKGKKEAAKAAPTKAAAPAKPEAKGKKGAEVVVVVPAPKGVAMLTKEGKGKKGKAASEGGAAGRAAKRCREPGCDHDFTILGYCRVHYIKNWRRIKRKESILASGQLNNYVEELVNKYPDKYLDVIRQDLATEKEWGKVVVDLELEGSDEDAVAEEDIDAAAEGVRAPSTGGSSRGEFEDEGDF